MIAVSEQKVNILTHFMKTEAVHISPETSRPADHYFMIPFLSSVRFLSHLLLECLTHCTMIDSHVILSCCKHIKL